MRSILIALTALLLAACAGPVQRPDFSRLYMSTRGAANQPPVILVHGVFGSKLRQREGGREIWPGGVGKLLFSDFSDLRLNIDGRTLMAEDDGVEAFGFFDGIAGQDFYGEVVRTLSGPGGYEIGTPGKAQGRSRRQIYLYSYDWRRDNIESVRGLDALIRQIQEDYGDPGLKVDIVAHSNGGLIARYYARYGTADWLDGNDFHVSQAGAANIRRLILLGTPNFGSVQAVKAMIKGSELGFRSLPPEVLLTFPTAYQLLPHALNTWLLDVQGQAFELDVFDIATWRRFAWSIFDPELRRRVLAGFAEPAAGQQYLELLERYVEKNLERARRFTWSLTVAEPMTGVRPVIFGGDCSLTPARLLVEPAGDEFVLRLWPWELTTPQAGVDYDALMLEPGDGAVTKASLLAREALDPGVPRHPYSHFPLDYSFFLCERHERLTGNPSFQDNLLHALLSVDR